MFAADASGSLRAADLVGEPELGRVTLSRRTMPRTSFLPIAVRVMFGEPVKVFFRLPFLQPAKSWRRTKKSGV